MELFFSESDISENDINSIIRPNRLSYSKSDLGPSTKNVKGTTMMRKDFQVQNSKSEKLQCSLYFPKNDQQSKLLIIYLHGNSGCRMEANPIVYQLIPLGYHVCSYDSSGCGQSEGQYVTLGLNERDDLQAVINRMKQQCGYTNFVLWGRSMGAVTSLLYCLQMQSMYVSAGGQQNNLNGVVGLVVDSAFANFATLTKEIAEKKISSFLVNIGIKHLRNKLKKKLNGLDLFEIDLTHQVSKLKLPAIFAYSDQDSVISPKHTNTLFTNYGGPKQKAQFTGDHNEMRSQSYFNQIIDFLNNYIRHYKGIDYTLQNIENQAIFSKTMTTPFSFNTIQSPQKVNPMVLTSSLQFYNNTQPTPAKLDAQTPRDGKSTHSQHQNVKEEQFRQSYQGKNLFQQQQSRQDTQKQEKKLNFGIPMNFVSQSVDVHPFAPGSQKNQTTLLLQKSPQIGNRVEINENYFSTTQQHMKPISLLRPPQPAQLNTEESIAYEAIGSSSAQNGILFQQPQFAQTVGSKSFYKTVQKPSIQNQALFQANTGKPSSSLGASNIQLINPNTQNIIQQQHQFVPYSNALNCNSNASSQIRIPQHQKSTSSTVKRSQSTSAFAPQAKKIDSNYLSNLKQLSFIETCSNINNNNTRMSSIYHQPMMQQTFIQPHQGKIQIANSIQLK